MNNVRNSSNGLESIAPPTGCHHYTDITDVPWDIQKSVLHWAYPVGPFLLDRCRYYRQRYSIFSKYHEGIWMTEDAWFGVTPEPVAQ